MLSGIPLTPFNLIGFAVLVSTAVILWRRYSRGGSDNAALLFWIAIIAHTRFFEGGYDPRWVGLGMVCCLLVRFEFLSGAVEKAILMLEAVAVGYVGWRTVGLLLLW